MGGAGVLHILIWAGLGVFLAVPVLFAAWTLYQIAMEHLLKQSEFVRISIPSIEERMGLLSDRVELDFRHYTLPFRMNHCAYGTMRLDGRVMWSRQEYGKSWDGLQDLLEKRFWEDMILYGTSHMKMMLEEADRRKERAWRVG